MKNCYVNCATWTIIDLINVNVMPDLGAGMLITRVHTKDEFRGQGAASRLLDQLLQDADRENVSLYLEILSSGQLTYEDLEAWYLRKGFVDHLTFLGMYVRRPKPVKS